MQMTTKTTWNDLQIRVNLDARVAVQEIAPGRTSVRIE